jgi:RNA polymerase sigma-70 factor, ECF subfamily
MAAPTQNQVMMTLNTQTETTMVNSDSNWEKCFAELAPRLVLYARQLTQTAADAEDVVQMAFVRWWRRFPNGDRDHVPLLYAAVRTIALDLRRSSVRRSKRENVSYLAEEAREPGYFELAAEQQDLARIVEKSMEGLPEEQREVVTLHVWGGLTFAQIAEATGASINTIAARYRYALKALLRKLEPMRQELLEPASRMTLASTAKPDLYYEHE